MDISSQFKTCIRSLIKTDEKVSNSSNLKSSIIDKKKSPFFINTKTITNQASKLYNLLIKNRDILNNGKYMINRTSLADLDSNDYVTQDIINASFKILEDLKKNIKDNCVSRQHEEHQKMILLFTIEYLKHICKIHAELKSLRISKATQLTEMNKLKSIVDKSSDLKKSLDQNKSHATKESLNIQEINGDISSQFPTGENIAILSEDVQMLEAENDQLFTDLNMLTEDIKQIESKVIQINELQEVFMDKVIDQDKNLDHVLTTIVGSTENVREANEQIREAIQRNAGLRVWILFFLLLMSFTLIFLDWYDT